MKQFAKRNQTTPAFGHPSKEGNLFTKVQILYFARWLLFVKTFLRVIFWNSWYQAPKTTSLPEQRRGASEYGIWIR